MTFAERFWSKVQKTEQCWWWIGFKDRKGYGRFDAVIDDKERPYLAHRVAMFLHTGQMPPADKMVCHHCDNPSCVNPDHLYIGTIHDNTRDALKRRKTCWGDKQGRTRLTNAQVKEIYQRCATRQRGQQRVLARQFNISEATVSEIVNRKHWRDVTL